MIDPKVFAQRLLESLVHGAAIRENLVVPDLTQKGNKVIQIRQKGLSDVDRRRTVRGLLGHSDRYPWFGYALTICADGSQ